MDLTSLFNYSAGSPQQSASLSLSAVRQKDMLQYMTQTQTTTAAENETRNDPAVGYDTSYM